MYPFRLVPLQFLMKVRHESEEVETAEHLVKKVLDRLNFVEVSKTYKEKLINGKL